MLSTYLLLILLLFFILTSLIPQYILSWQLEYRKKNIEMTCIEIGDKVDYYLRFYDSSMYKTYLDTITQQYSKTLDSRVMVFDKFGRILSDSNKQYEYRNINVKEITESLVGKTDWANYFFNDIGNVLYLSVPVY